MEKTTIANRADTEKLLNELKIPFTVYEHEEAHTME